MMKKNEKKNIVKKKLNNEKKRNRNVRKKDYEDKRLFLPRKKKFEPIKILNSPPYRFCIASVSVQLCTTDAS